MSSNTINKKNAESGRIEEIKKAVQTAAPSICTERALIWTSYHKNISNRKKSPYIKTAEALRKVLLEKSIKIYQHELIAGNYTSKRVGGSIYPELHGVPVMLDLFRFPGRKTNPLKISGKETLALLKIIPFWLFRFMGLKAYRSPFKKIRFLVNQLRAHFYLINEGGGISHLAPDYNKLITMGTRGFYNEACMYQEKTKRNSESWNFYEGVKIITKGLESFGARYADLSEKMAAEESDSSRRVELESIAFNCSNDLRNGASSFSGALQVIFLAQIAINLESLDNAVCPGRLDQYLYQFYKNDINRKIITGDNAKELVAAFCLKMSEIIPVFSKHLTNFHGGMFNGQVVTVGGLDPMGKDSTNELSFIFLEVMDELRVRQPNLHARVHKNSPAKFTDYIFSILAEGSNSPAIYNDDVIIKTMKGHGYALQDARDYTGVGCVEPVCQGKSFSSTDAALFNTPLVLELALNRGRRFGSIVRTGAGTLPVSSMKNMDDVKEAFARQLEYMLEMMKKDLQAVEIANRRHHPTPLTSMLIDGCLSSGTCSTSGGAKYNFSGIQCVAPVDVGDALRAIEKSVFIDNRFSLPDLARFLKNNMNNPDDLAYLKNIIKFGNDDEKTDRWSVYVVDTFVKAINSLGSNTRGGAYATGLYSVTAHEYFGRVTSALPHGRRKGEPFASGIAPLNGMDRLGPTALLNSMNRIDFTQIANGINFNIKFSPHTMRGKTGMAALSSLIKTYFKRGGMQVQVNVINPEVLIEARDNPELYPHLLVRVSGYSAYFNDLSSDMKEEIIRRTTLVV